MAIQYLAIDSFGVAFDIEETRSVEVTNEALNAGSGFLGDLVMYTAEVKDNIGEALPPAFYAKLMINGTELQAGYFQPNVYDPVTFTLTIPFTVPDLMGSYTVKLTSEDQVI